MAAHIKTALDQTLNDIKSDNVIWPHLMAALDFSTWTEDLDFDDYIQLSKIVKNEDITQLDNWIDEIYKKYFVIWSGLKYPKTREEWNKEKYRL